MDWLHVFDLQIIPDATLATLLELSDNTTPRQAALTQLQGQYHAWCQACSGLSHVCCIYCCSLEVSLGHAVQAPDCSSSPGSYPSVSQKIMKGACSRFMTLWLAEITCKLVVDQLTAHRANVFISLANLFELMCANGRYWQSADAPKAFYQAYLV